MAIFISTFVNAMDVKNRVVVPKDFRAMLSDYSAFVAFRSHKLNAVDCFTMKKMEELSEKIDRDYDGFSLDRESLESAVFADAVMLKFDKDGRVVIPDLLLQHANISNQIAFVGKGSTFQIWEPEAFKNHQETVRKKLLEKK
ncbi:division/cell wall cluster transcriptional repressor MraZ [Alphaproteobacteria bacterium endosymbiont of Tiliacea citrago]|uniref:division/cell wall cluster transcriptional repressor MraZ n=1 Tax=Alphaproteobacteria bacterium endosymbiont of Tiliacea citrago TaxID=3077944 RepID=UPI00313B15C3